jgi:histidinol-phosphate aminotransferase
MSVSRRSFFHTVGAGSAVLSADFLIGRGREAMAFERAEFQAPDDGGFLRIDSNENARGPGRSALEAIKASTTHRVGRGYAPDNVMDLYNAIASAWGVERTHVITATGSGPILEAATRAYCAVDRPLVTAAPTFSSCEQTARRMGVPVKVVPVDKSLGLDIAGMTAAAQGAGLVFFCNPNNPTGTAHDAATVEKFIRGLAPSRARCRWPRNCRR